MFPPEPRTPLGRPRSGSTERVGPNRRPDRGDGPSAFRRRRTGPAAGATAAGDERPWDRPGAVRRDWPAHRGELLLALADASLLLGALSLCLGFLALAAVACGAAAWGLSWRDLGRMRARRMDPGGLAAARRARARALAGAALGLYGALLWACFLARLYFPSHR